MLRTTTGLKVAAVCAALAVGRVGTIILALADTVPVFKFVFLPVEL